MFGKFLLIWRKFSPFIKSDKFYLYVYYFLCLKRHCSFKNPQRFTEKIQCLKLYNSKFNLSPYVDKINVKQIVSSLIGNDYVLPLLGEWDSFDEINFDKLPDKFVLKCNHDSGTHYVCNDKNLINRNALNEYFTKSLGVNYFYISREHPYKYIKPKIFAEAYLNDPSSESLIDYKFYCFSGVVKFFMVRKQVASKNYCCYFDSNLKKINFITDSDDFIFNFDLPSNIKKMIELSEDLSSAFLHVRVDLYSVSNQIFFGEYTFHTSGGILKFHPDYWDFELGKFISLPI